jgi:hypothetical protein
VSYADLRRSYDRLTRTISTAGSDRGALLAAVGDLGAAAGQLRTCSRRHARDFGRTHGVRVADIALREVALLESDVSPFARYIWTESLETRLWSATRAIERAAIALRWESMETPR